MDDVLVAERCIRVMKGGYVEQPSGRRIGDQLTQWRNERGLSREDVARTLGWTLGKYTRIEAERKSMPEPEDLQELADFYNTTVDELLRIGGYPLVHVYVEKAELESVSLR